MTVGHVPPHSQQSDRERGEAGTRGRTMSIIKTFLREQTGNSLRLIDFDK